MRWEEVKEGYLQYLFKKIVSGQEQSISSNEFDQLFYNAKKCTVMDEGIRKAYLAEPTHRHVKDDLSCD